MQQFNGSMTSTSSASSRSSLKNMFQNLLPSMDYSDNISHCFSIDSQSDNESLASSSLLGDVSCDPHSDLGDDRHSKPGGKSRHKSVAKKFKSAIGKISKHKKHRHKEKLRDDSMSIGSIDSGVVMDESTSSHVGPTSDESQRRRNRDSKSSSIKSRSHSRSRDSSRKSNRHRSWSQSVSSDSGSDLDDSSSVVSSASRSRSKREAALTRQPNSRGGGLGQRAKCFRRPAAPANGKSGRPSLPSRSKSYDCKRDTEDSSEQFGLPRRASSFAAQERQRNAAASRSNQITAQPRPSTVRRPNPAIAERRQSSHRRRTSGGNTSGPAAPVRSKSFHGINPDAPGNTNLGPSRRAPTRSYSFHGMDGGEPKTPAPRRRSNSRSRANPSLSRTTPMALCRHGEALGECCYEQANPLAAASPPLFSLDDHFGASSSGGLNAKEVCAASVAEVSIDCDSVDSTSLSGFLVKQNSTKRIFDDAGLKMKGNRDPNRPRSRSRSKSRSRSNSRTREPEEQEQQLQSCPDGLPRRRRSNSRTRNDRSQSRSRSLSRSRSTSRQPNKSGSDRDRSESTTRRRRSNSRSRRSASKARGRSNSRKRRSHSQRPSSQVRRSSSQVRSQSERDRNRSTSRAWRESARANNLKQYETLSREDLLHGTNSGGRRPRSLSRSRQGPSQGGGETQPALQYAHHRVSRSLSRTRDGHDDHKNDRPRERSTSRTRGGSSGGGEGIGDYLNRKTPANAPTKAKAKEDDDTNSQTTGSNTTGSNDVGYKTPSYIWQKGNRSSIKHNEFPLPDDSDRTESARNRNHQSFATGHSGYDGSMEQSPSNQSPSSSNTPGSSSNIPVSSRPTQTLKEAFNVSVSSLTISASPHTKAKHLYGKLMKKEEELLMLNLTAAGSDSGVDINPV
jgi:hypothetical protein